MGKEKLPVHARSRCHSRSKSQVRHPNHRIPWGQETQGGEGQKKWNSKKWSQKKIHELLLFSSTKIYIFIFVLRSSKNLLDVYFDKEPTSILQILERLYRQRPERIGYACRRLGAGILLEFGRLLSHQTPEKGKIQWLNCFNTQDSLFFLFAIIQISLNLPWTREQINPGYTFQSKEKECDVSSHPFSVKLMDFIPISWVWLNLKKPCPKAPPICENPPPWIFRQKKEKNILESHVQTHLVAKV